MDILSSKKQLGRTISVLCPCWVLSELAWFVLNSEPAEMNWRRLCPRSRGSGCALARSETLSFWTPQLSYPATNGNLLQPFWGLIQCPLRWDNAPWFQWAVNYILYFWPKNSFNVLPSLYYTVLICISPSPSKLQILHPVHIPQLDSSSEEQHPQELLWTPTQPLFITPPALSLSLIKTGISHFSCNIPNQLLTTHTE